MFSESKGNQTQSQGRGNSVQLEKVFLRKNIVAVLRF